MNYQVGDLFCALYDKNRLFLLTEIPNEDVYVIYCMRTYKFFGYSKDYIDFDFRKVN